MERRAEDKNDDENRVNEYPKLTKHSANSEYLMENLEMKEGRSPARSDVSNNRDDVLELTPVETRASRGMKHSKESSRFSETGTSRTIGSSLQSDDNDNGDNDKHDNDNDNGIEMKNLKDSNGEIKGETKVGKEAEIETGKGETGKGETAAGETESNGNEMDEELLAKLKSKSKLILPEDETQSATEAEMEAEKDQEDKKKAEDESEANQKKPKGVGTIDKKALLVIGDEIVAEESNKMNRVDDDKMVDEDKIQEEEKEKDKNVENERINKEEKEKIKLDSEEVARKAKNLAKLYNDINSEIQHIVNRDKSLFQKDPALATKQSGGELGKGGQSMSTASLPNLRNDERVNAPSNAGTAASNPNSNGPQRMNELEDRAKAMSDSYTHNPMSFDRQEEESLEKSTRSSKRSPLYYEKNGYRRRPMQTESFQYSVSHVSLYPSFLEIGIASNFDGVSYCSVFDRKGNCFCSCSHSS